LKNFMSVDKGLPRDDDRARYLDIKLSDKKEFDQFKEDGGMVNVVFYRWLGSFEGQAFDENGFVCLGLPLETVTHWRYVT